MSVKWALVTRSGGGLGCPPDYEPPEGCEIASYGASGGHRGRMNYYIIRCADAAALTRLRQAEDWWPWDHTEDPEDPDFHACGAEKSVVLEYGRDPRKVTCRCTNCGDSWVIDFDVDDTDWEPSVELFPTRRAAVEEVDDRTMADFLGF
jgi:hypothetical protein